MTDGTDEKANAFFPGVLTAPIVENGSVAPDNTVILTPDGAATLKRVQIQNAQNTHEVDCYIRVMLVPAFRTNEGTLAANVTLNPSGNNVSVTAPNGERCNTSACKTVGSMTGYTITDIFTIKILFTPVKTQPRY